MGGRARGHEEEHRGCKASSMLLRRTKILSSWSSWSYCVRHHPPTAPTRHARTPPCTRRPWQGSGGAAAGAGSAPTLAPEPHTPRTRVLLLRRRSAPGHTQRTAPPCPPAGLPTAAASSSLAPGTAPHLSCRGSVQGGRSAPFTIAPPCPHTPQHTPHTTQHTHT